MKKWKPSILLATNGCDDNRPALEHGIWLAGKLGAPVTLLGIAEPSDAQHPVKQMLEETARRLAAQKVHYGIQNYNDHAEEALKNVSVQGSYDLLVLGPLGRPPLRRWLMGRSFRHIMAEVEVPILYVQSERIPTKRILICMGGLGYGLTVERLSLQMARTLQVEATLLHVVPPIDLDYPVARTVKENWDHLTDTDTTLGRTLRLGMQTARDIVPEATLKVRQGIVVEEILKEIHEGDYDLVCMGSPHSAHGLRQLYVSNVTADVAEAVRCPILTARYSPEIPDQTTNQA
jgi:nucleotide-binding universal stress UspA family protein